MTTPAPVRSNGDPIPAEHSKGSVAEPQGAKPFPVVGIGASAGGLEALNQLLAHLPDDTGMAFVVVQHLDPKHESQLTGLLAKATRMPVVEVVQGVGVLPNHVYVIPPNASLSIAGGVLHVSPRAETVRPHLPVDFLFRSLAEDQQARAIGVVLSGTGADGTLGMCEIKAVGGITFAQEERTARHPGMPHSAIDSGCVDFVLAPEEIAARLAELGSHPYLAEAEPVDLEEDEEQVYKRILSAVRAETRVDFSLYRDTTIKRRIMRRMALHTEQSLTDYARRLETDRDEVDALYHDLLINVTSFFRDPELFEELKVHVFPEIAKEKSPTTPLRVWVPGCSTGQEAYSLAIALLEFFDDRPFRPPIQIFATDLSDPASLDKARAGVYPDSIEADVSPERLRRFFKREDHLYRIEKSIRDMCVFARQNVTSDPPFSHLDVISCRNVLIYLATPLQRRVLPAFHYSLNAPGFLVLGSAETVGENSDLFDLVDRSSKIYAKKPTASRVPLYFPSEDFKSVAAAAARRPGTPPPTPADFEREADRILLGRFAPPGVLVNENLDIIQFRGRTSAFLEPPPGEPTTSLLKMAREGLFLELRSVLAEVQQSKRPARRDRVRVRGNGGAQRDVNIEVVPVTPLGGRDGCFLVLFHDADSDAGLAATETLQPIVESDAREEVRLRQELAATKEYLQSLVEQQDAANEELRSANEEILSSNEELQSTNEELETAKEELQSTNEELTTVNEQLQHRNVELSRANNDLTNLLSSINIPVVMVGGDLRIRRFTPPARKSMSLLPTDLNRPISDVTPAALVPDLGRMIEQVIETVKPVEREIRDREGRWHALRIFPYRTADHKIDGAVIVFVDIDQHKQAELTLRDADRRKDEFLATLAHELRNPLAPMQNAIEIIEMAGANDGVLERAREVLQRQIRHLTRIVSDLIDVSRITERKIELQRQHVSLAALVENAIESCRANLESDQHPFKVTLPSEPLYLDADPIRLSQVIINLVNNAAKFSEAGSPISLTAEKASDRELAGANVPGAPDEVLIRVRDQGQGIPWDVLPRIFDMFMQGPGALVDRQGGLGVGLALARNLVQLHGGTIEARSAGPHQGSEFVVRLPLAIPEAAAPSESAPATLTRTSDPKRILIVDDNRDHAESLGLLLELMGHRVQLADDGIAALSSAAEFQPDVALIDLGLPGLNGLEVARTLRADERYRNLVLVAQTGWGQEEDRRRSREAGFDHHLVKPIGPEHIGQVLEAKRIEL